MRQNKKKNIVILTAVMVLVLVSGCVDKNDEMISVMDQNSEYITNESSSDLDNNEDVVEIERNAENSSEGVDNDSLHSFVVYVCGEVKNPGVYSLYEGGRVIDAVNAAGGFSVDASIDYLNLALTISDGEKIYVPSFEEVERISEEKNLIDTIDFNDTNPTSSKSGNQNKSEMVNINTASESELMTLPGIGQSKANAIITYRTENGKFTKIEDLMNIRGIKDGLFNKVKDLICVN